MDSPAPLGSYLTPSLEHATAGDVVGPRVLACTPRRRWSPWHGQRMASEHVHALVVARAGRRRGGGAVSLGDPDGSRALAERRAGRRDDGRRGRPDRCPPGRSRRRAVGRRAADGRPSRDPCRRGRWPHAPSGGRRLDARHHGAWGGAEGDQPVTRGSASTRGTPVARAERRRARWAMRNVDRTSRPAGVPAPLVGRLHGGVSDACAGHRGRAGTRRRSRRPPRRP